jgi:hypothetical protein
MNMQPQILTLDPNTWNLIFHNDNSIAFISQYYL